MASARTSPNTRRDGTFLQCKCFGDLKNAVRLWSGTQGMASSSGGDGCCHELEGSGDPAEGKQAVTCAGKDQLKGDH